jgi:lauroyl/myristoyl acyltransferase
MAFGSPAMIASVHLKDRYIARRAGPRHVPSLLLTKDLRTITEVLSSQCVLTLCVDTGTGKDITGRADGARLRMASGAIRLARSQEAHLVPALIYEEKPWHYVVRIDPPVPWEDMPDDESVADALTRTFLPFIAPRVEQYECGPLVFWSADQDSGPPEACTAERQA